MKKLLLSLLLLTSVAKAQYLAVYMISAEWCRACKYAKPIFLKVKASNPTIDMQIRDGETDKAGRELAEAVGLKAYPTYIFIDYTTHKSKGFKVQGVLEEDELLKRIKDLKDGNYPVSK